MLCLPGYKTCKSIQHKIILQMYFKQININSIARHMSVSNTFYSLCILCMHDFPVCVFNQAFRGCQNPINGLCELYKSLKH